MGISINEFKNILAEEKNTKSNDKLIIKYEKQIEKLKYKNEKLLAEIKPLKKLLQLTWSIHFSYICSDTKNLSQALKKLFQFLDQYTKYGENDNELEIKT